MADAPRAKPNILLILADDMRYSDIGCFGSEIPTPVLDGLADRGVRFTQGYNCARCCPSRASLMTGLYPHKAGVGEMTGDAGPDYPAYRGFLNPDAPKLLRYRQLRETTNSITLSRSINSRLRKFVRGLKQDFGVRAFDWRV